MLRDMFKKTYTLIDTKYKNHSKNEPNIPECLWRKCKKCGQPVYGEDVKNNNYICPKCKAYFRVHAYRRIDLVVDPGTFEEWNAQMDFSNPLGFPGYEEKVQAAQETTSTPTPAPTATPVQSQAVDAGGEDKDKKTTKLQSSIDTPAIPSAEEPSTDSTLNKSQGLSLSTVQEPWRQRGTVGETRQ